MSFSMFARPAPEPEPEYESFGTGFKRILATALLDHDGSLRTEPFKLGQQHIPLLRGIKAAAGNHDIITNANTLIAMLEDNPQGVEAWIGEESDIDA